MTKNENGIYPEMNHTAGADPGFFVGGGQTQEMGAIWPLWSPHCPKFSLSTAHIGYIRGKISTKIRNFIIKYQSFGPKIGAFFCRGGGQGTLAPAPGSAPAQLTS